MVMATDTYILKNAVVTALESFNGKRQMYCVKCKTFVCTKKSFLDYHNVWRKTIFCKIFVLVSFGHNVQNRFENCRKENRFNENLVELDRGTMVFPQYRRKWDTFIHKVSAPAKETEHNFPKKKVMEVAVWNTVWVLLTKYMPRESIINVKTYRNQIIILYTVLEEKRPVSYSQKASCCIIQVPSLNVKENSVDTNYWFIDYTFHIIV